MSTPYQVDRIYSYIIVNDSGFAPNPFWGTCTLACCKPTIRRSIGKKWDPSKSVWIAGISPKKFGNKLVYLMKVDEVMSFNDYYETYPCKIPDFKLGRKHKRGDNIYKPFNGSFEQLKSFHSNNDRENDAWSVNETNMRRDLNGEFVLLSNNFVYFGKDSIPLEKELTSLIGGRGHKCNFSQEVLEAFYKLVNGKKEEIKNCTVMACPNKWSENENCFESKGV